MRRTISGLLAGVTLGCGGLAAADEPVRPLTFQDARTLPADELARRALTQFADQLVEVDRPNGGGFIGDQLVWIGFAGRPRGAGDPGVCEVDYVTVGFTAVSPGDMPPRGSRATNPAQADSLTVVTRFKTVGDISPLPDTWNDAYGAKLDAACAALPTALDFFDAPDVNAAWHAATVLKIAKGPSWTGFRVECEGNETEAACHARKILDKVTIADLLSVQRVDCGVPDENLICQELTLSPGHISGSGERIIIQARFRLDQTNPAPEPEVEIESLTVIDSYIIYD